MWLIIAWRSVLPRQALHPARLLGVPGQGVAAHLHAALDRPVVDLVAGAEVELAPLRLGGVRLHLVLGRHHVELAVRRSCVYVESPSLPAAMAVPKYRPDCAAAAPSVLAAAFAFGIMDTTVSGATTPAAPVEQGLVDRLIASAGRRHDAQWEGLSSWAPFWPVLGSLRAGKPGTR